MKKFLTLVLALLFAAQLTLAATANTLARSITIMRAEGNVTMTKGTPRTFPARVNFRMANGYTITVGRNSHCWLNFRQQRDCPDRRPEHDRVWRGVGAAALDLGFERLDHGERRGAETRQLDRSPGG